MISHLRVLSVIQVIRCVVGLGIGTLLIWRSYNIPNERLSRLEPWDRRIFLVAGIVFMALAILRGMQGSTNLLLFRKPWPGTVVQILSWLPWALPLAMVGGIFYYLIVISGKSPEAADEFLYRWLLPWTLVAVYSVAWIVIAISKRLLRGRRKPVRRLGAFMSWVDVVDLTGFPFTTGCGTYGVLVYRHPDVLDFFEGVFSSGEAAPPTRSDQKKSLRNPGNQERKNLSPPVPGFLDS